MMFELLFWLAVAGVFALPLAGGQQQCCCSRSMFVIDVLESNLLLLN
jgi:hypothetical protein